MTAKQSISELHAKYYGKKKPAMSKTPIKKETDRDIALRIAPELKTKDKKMVLAREHTSQRMVLTDPKTAKKLEGSPKEGIVMHAGATRNEIMLQCKEKGVKNFRVLNKQEMVDILKNIGDQKYIDIVVEGAVRRWKSGWKKNKEVSNATV